MLICKGFLSIIVKKNDMAAKRITLTDEHIRLIQNIDFHALLVIFLKMRYNMSLETMNRLKHVRKV